MKKVRFVFYVAKFEWRNLFIKGRKIRVVDDGISFWTGLFNWFTPGYSHMSVWKQDETFGFMTITHTPRFRDVGPPDPEIEYIGICYTSTMRGDDNGTVSRPASTVFTHPERWEYIEFEVTDESFEEAKAWADERVKQKWSYSKKDLLRFAMPLWMLKRLKIADPDREICSEHGEGWAVRLWTYSRKLNLNWRLLWIIRIRSPRRLWRDLTKRHKIATYSLATGKMVRDKNGKKA